MDIKIEGERIDRVAPEGTESGEQRSGWYNSKGALPVFVLSRDSQN